MCVTIERLAGDDCISVQGVKLSLLPFGGAAV